MNPPQKRSYSAVESSVGDMKQPPKRPRPNLDADQLSLDDQLAFQRVAAILNKPVSALFEANQHQTNNGQAVSDQYPLEEVVYKSPPSWQIHPEQWQCMDTWEQDFAHGDMDNRVSQPNGLWTQAPGTILGDDDFLGGIMNQWTEDVILSHAPRSGETDSHDSSDVLNRAIVQRTPSWLHEATVDEPWVSVPTDFLNQTSLELDNIESMKNTQESGGEPPFPSSDAPSQSPWSTSGARNEENNRQAISSRSNGSTIQFLNGIANFNGAELNWSNANGHQKFLLDNTGKASVKWVSNESSNKVASSQRRRGPFQNQREREQTSIVRKSKACVRCRMQKIRCLTNEIDPNGCCVTCASIKNTKQKIHTLPCLRHKMTEVTLYRTGKAPGLEFTFRWPKMTLTEDICDWADTRVRTIQILSDVCPEPLELSVRKFIPISQDTVQKSWMDGKTKKFKLTTNYAIVNMSKTVKDMEQYINDNVFKALEFWLRDSDPLIRETYSFMRKYMLVAPTDEAKQLIADSFRIWFSIRRTATTESIIGDDTLDMEPELNDKSYPLFGKVPLPPVMIQQLDMILTLGLLKPLRKRVLDQLQKIILDKKPKNWITIYLITFMSLHNAANLTHENYKNARKHGLKRRYAMPNFMEQRHHGANVYLSHYHYCTTSCNPFTLDWKKRQTTPFAELTTNEIDFILKTSEMVEERRDKFRRIRENELYEDDLYFVSQMYEKEWTPRDTVIDFGDETIVGVPLKQFGSPPHA